MTNSPVSGSSSDAFPQVKITSPNLGSCMLASYTFSRNSLSSIWTPFPRLFWREMQEPARNGTGRSERVLALYQDDADLPTPRST